MNRAARARNPRSTGDEKARKPSKKASGQGQNREEREREGARDAVAREGGRDGATSRGGVKEKLKRRPNSQRVVIIRPRDVIKDRARTWMLAEGGPG